MSAGNRSFPGPCAIECHNIPVRIGQVQLQACQIPDDDALARPVGDDAGADNHIAVLEHGVVHLQVDGQLLVRHLDLYRGGVFGILGVGLCQGIRKRRFAVYPAVSLIGEVQRGHAVGVFDQNRRRAEVSLAGSAGLEAGGLEEHHGVLLRVAYAGTDGCCALLLQGIDQCIIPELSAVVEVLQMPGGGDSHDVCCSLAVQPDDSVLNHG